MAKKAKKVITNIDWKPVNIVCSGKINRSLNLERLARKFSKAIEYTPENFPGLIYRMGWPPAVFLIFSTGKVVCTGLRSLNKVEIAFKELKKVLENFE